jgi:hypothetical protein
MAALPKSPAGRRSSSGNGLRPVLPIFDLDTGSALDLDDLEESELGPAPREESTPFAEGAGVDEVEYAYGYGDLVGKVKTLLTLILVFNRLLSFLSVNFGSCR